MKFSEWKRGDELRVLSAYGPFTVGEVVLHDDNDGDDAPYCSKLDGTVLKWALCHERLEFVRRPSNPLMPVPVLTEEQLEQIAAVFGLTRKKSAESLPVRDGRVEKGDKVWWRYEEGPEQVNAGYHWGNIQNLPEAYQLAKPTGSYVGFKYED